MKRTKTVYKNVSELAHVWAQQKQTEGKTPYRNSSGGMFGSGNGFSGRSAFFETDTIYSYGKHFPMAKFHGNVVLITSESYSTTTSSHISDVRSAVSHKDTFTVPNVLNPKCEKNIQHLVDGIVNEYNSIITGRSGNKYYTYHTHKRVTELRLNIQEFNEYCKTFGIKDSIVISNEDVLLLNECLKVQDARNAERDAVKQAKRIELDKKLAIENAEKIERWKNGEMVNLPYLNLPYDLVRVKGNTVQTHRGATVPLDEAISLIDYIKKYGEKGMFKGKIIGEYTVESLKGDVLTIGCHKFKLSDVSQIISNTVPLKLVQGGKQ
jgi:hypothetical protein